MGLEDRSPQIVSRCNCHLSTQALTMSIATSRFCLEYYCAWCGKAANGNGLIESTAVALLVQITALRAQAMVCGWRSVLLVFSSTGVRHHVKGQAGSAPLLLHKHRQLSSCAADSSKPGNSQQQGPLVFEDDQHSIRTEELPLPVWRVMQQLRAAGK